MHGFEPGLPSLSYLALRDASALTVATFLSAERLSYPPGRAQRDRLLGRLDALVATSETTAEAAAARFPGHYEVLLVSPDPLRAVGGCALAIAWGGVLVAGTTFILKRKDV